MMRTTLFAVTTVCILASGCNQQDGWQLFGDQSVESDRHRTAAAPAAPKVQVASKSQTVDASRDIQIADQAEYDLADDVSRLRNHYVSALNALRDYYKASGKLNKLRMCEKEIAQAAQIRPYPYVHDSSIAEADLQALESVPQADALYDRALELMQEGGYGQTRETEIERFQLAYAILIKLIDRYPQSDKIDDAAFCCGEILKECFPGRETDAIRWYKRCITWDPQTPHPARLQAAILYDFRLKNMAQAVPFYRAVIENQTARPEESAFASRRLES